MCDDNNRTCLIISGSPEFVLPDKEYHYVIACDAGLYHALNHQIHPDLVVGDFDSFLETIPEGLNVVHVPEEKDDTDTMLAVRHALSEGFRKILMTGVLGRRLDHTLGNLSACAYASEHGTECVLYGLNDTIYTLTNGTLKVKQKEHCAVSVFSYSEKSVGINYKGLKYPLTEATLFSTFARGISNEFETPEAEISVRDGLLLIVLSRKDQEV